MDVAAKNLDSNDRFNHDCDDAKNVYWTYVSFIDLNRFNEDNCFDFVFNASFHFGHYF